jgi:hypothetical protein
MFKGVILHSSKLQPRVIYFVVSSQRRSTLPFKGVGTFIDGPLYKSCIEMINNFNTDLQSSTERDHDSSKVR